MQRGILVQNRVAAPTGDMTDGHAYYSELGVPTWRFAGTTLAFNGSAATATAGGITPPSQVAGYLTITLNGIQRKIGVYAN
jgi:hypothetical protein